MKVKKIDWDHPPIQRDVHHLGNQFTDTFSLMPGRRIEASIRMCQVRLVILGSQSGVYTAKVLCIGNTADIREIELGDHVAIGSKDIRGFHEPAFLTGSPPRLIE